jgi:divinyl chlorophyllide a 8-vinyl-reductase
VPKDSWAVDYGGGLNTLNAFCKNAVGDSPHFVLLSAFCVGKPRLQFQLAKLKLEEAIRSETSVSHSIVRPTAYFKSVDGQLESVSKGNPVLFFGDGTCSANAISETDLANYLCNCIFDPSLLMNGTRDIGGPDVPPITKRQTAELIFDTLKVPQDKRRVVSLPLGIFDFIISAFSSFEKVFKALGLQELSGNCADGAEIARIVHYYASEPMVAVGEGSVQGTVHLKDHFEKLAQRGGLEEIDPMTTTAGVLSAIATNNKSVRVRS